MEKYPATYREFKVNGSVFKMYKLTLGMQSKIEDEDIAVLKMDVILDCTDMDSSFLDTLRMDQFDAVYDDVMSFNYEEPLEGRGERKKPLS